VTDKPTPPTTGPDDPRFTDEAVKKLRDAIKRDPRAKNEPKNPPKDRT
jgi:hypothetical protein